MITAQRDDAWKRPAILRWTFLIRIGLGLSRQQRIVTLFNLRDGDGIVIPGTISRVGQAPNFDLRGHRNVAAINHRGPTVEGIGIQGHVIASTKGRPT